jgi:hypothetical protein
MHYSKVVSVEVNDRHPAFSESGEKAAPADPRVVPNPQPTPSEQANHRLDGSACFGVGSEQLLHAAVTEHDAEEPQDHEHRTRAARKRIALNGT